MCWYCTWGWPQPVADIYLEALDRLDGNSSVLEYGPAHIVWGDANFDSAQWCIDNFDKLSEDLSEYERCVVMWSLVELNKLPPNVRNIDPYDGSPPRVPVVKVEVYDDEIEPRLWTPESVVQSRSMIWTPETREYRRYERGKYNG